MERQKKTGSTWSKLHNKWRVRLTVDGKRKQIGMFTSEEEALKAYQEAVIKYEVPKSNSYSISGETIEIELSKDKVTIIDLEDLEKVLVYKWHYSENTNGHGCAKTNTGTVDGKQQRIKLHQYLMGVENGMEVDHISGDELDNRKENLRICLHQENMFNQKKTTRVTSSGYKGVSLNKKTGKYVAYITYNYKRIHLGSFHTEDEAANVYNTAAVEYFGEFAKLNVI